ncbi:MAG TPA: PH domain-containing protein [Burkholderiaceae bacterium]|nr:PH domain-containing protein [Burkholderiaceae bacterium]
MGLISGLMGNASKADAGRVQEELARLLSPGEAVEHAYQLIRDQIVFTNRRLLLIDRQGMTGSKVEYHSIPYRSITQFSVESAGTFDLEAELKIWVSGQAAPYGRTFNRKLDIYEVQAVLAGYVAK